ncbi:MAG: dTMP kinase [Beijerinckiaceae bacterium]|nr:dTMP kinase [Beijerinckiaceae bacterium]
MIEPDQRGRFITFEGGEGAGKSTQATRLAARLRARGFDPVLTREPGGSPLAEDIRKAILSGAVAPLGPAAEAIMFSAARIDHLERTIRPALARGQWVVCDRFADSTRAYQGALGNLDPRFMRELERVTVGKTMPDLTIVIDVPASTGLARARARSAIVDRFEAEGQSFHDALRRAFLDIAAQEAARCVVVDGALPADDVEAAIWSAVETRLLAGRMQGSSLEGGEAP